jgi:ketosteroid isomerase-like protein
MTFLFKSFAVGLALFALLPAQAGTSPEHTAGTLLAADRAFAERGAHAANAIEAIGAMLTDDAITPLPGGRFAHGRAAVLEAMRANPDNTSARVSWTPARVGVSADGTQGFSLGYMTVHRADGSTSPLKYMAYWIQRDGEWRVAVYKRARRPEGDVPSAMMAPWLPSAMVAPDPSKTRAAETSLAAAELAFSDESQRIGLGPAFVKFGAADAVNMGAGPAFLVGNDAIGAFVGAGAPAGPGGLRWSSSERVIAASSGDLGISIGLIHRVDAKPGTPEATPSAFFTIWINRGAGWRFIAE